MKKAFNRMHGILRLISALTGFALVLATAGCELESANKNAAPATNTNTTSSAPAEPGSTKLDDAGLKDQARALPPLDTFFAQEGFADELKSNLQLTEAQVDQLRAIARQENLSVRRNNNQVASTAAVSREQTFEKIEGVIGEPKTKALIAFAAGRVNSPNASAPPTSSVTPNTAPQDTRIVVNAPAFRMDVFEDGRLMKSYKIGIGYPEFPLPTGLRKAETIIFNPTWTPPDEPWVESPNSKVKVGEKIAAGDKLNPLGPIKIPIGLPSLIHGGKSAAKLGGFASHGCVGLTTPQVEEFSERLAQLAGTQLSQEQIAEYLKHKTETKSVKLGKTVLVELRYETITVENGKLHIYRDVYARGTTTEENLRSVLQSYGVSFDRLSAAIRANAMRALGAMSRNAGGKPVTETTSSSAQNKNAVGNVTRIIKGAKEAVIDIPDLAGKGYPDTVDLDTGVPARAAAPRGPRRR